MNLDNKIILITGSCGFIGYHLVCKLLNEVKSSTIIGIDNMNNYYDVELKEWRLNEINQKANLNSNKWIFKKGTIADKEFLGEIFEKYEPSIVINLAAQAGVRYSIENPDAYIESNIIGFYNILEACRNSDVIHLVFASSSSVYGNNLKSPYSTKDITDYPVSLYAATKKSDEALAHAYSKLYNIPITGLRFFTVYGAAGRPDMAYFSFTQNLINRKKIKVFNYGNCLRDFTYIDDIIEGLIRVTELPPSKFQGKDELPVAPYKLYNIGNNHPVKLFDFIKILIDELTEANILPQDFNINDYIELLPMQPGDVEETCADIKDLEQEFNFKPTTDLKIGLKHFVNWYKNYYKVEV